MISSRGLVGAILTMVICAALFIPAFIKNKEIERLEAGIERDLSALASIARKSKASIPLWNNSFRNVKFQAGTPVYPDFEDQPERIYHILKLRTAVQSLMIEKLHDEWGFKLIYLNIIGDGWRKGFTERLMSEGQGEALVDMLSLEPRGNDACNAEGDVNVYDWSDSNVVSGVRQKFIYGHGGLIESMPSTKGNNKYYHGSHP